MNNITGKKVLMLLKNIQSLDCQEDQPWEDAHSC